MWQAKGRGSGGKGVNLLIQKGHEVGARQGMGEAKEDPQDRIEASCLAPTRDRIEASCLTPTRDGIDSLLPRPYVDDPGGEAGSGC